MVAAALPVPIPTVAGGSKSHLSVIENGTGRSSRAAILHKLTVVLGVALADLLGREIRASASSEVPPSLLEFTHPRGLPQADVDMLASIALRG